MKVLVATNLTQGTKASDVMHCIDGELVFMVEACPYSRRQPYGACDCGITFRGMTSDGVATTAVVREMPGLSIEAYVDCLEATHRFKRERGCTCALDAFGDAWTLLALAGSLVPGTVVERYVDRIEVRQRA
ncbi:MAG: hypothetical protein M3Y52_01590 [Actinomycetota bacterium]|nr:hypothetical protein [Actinomycetota bacterium]